MDDGPKHELVERPDLLPAPVQIEEPPKFRGLHRRNFSRALYAHAALEQFQLEVRGMRGRLELFLRQLEEDSTLTSPAHVAGRIASLTRRIARLSQIVKFARSQLNAETIPTAILPSPHVFISTYRRLDGLDLRELADIQKEYGRLAHDVNNRLAIAMGNASLMGILRDLQQLKPRIEIVMTALVQADEEIHGALDKRKLSNQNIAGALTTLEGLKTIMTGRIAVHVDSRVEGKDYSGGIAMAPDHFSGLVFNLTDNAQKAGAKNMTISVRAVQGEFVVSFTDDGPGFKGRNPLDASKESKDITAAKMDGTSNGNGLPICYDFCRKAGGTLHLEKEKASDAPTGAEFTVRLPLLKGRR